MKRIVYIITLFLFVSSIYLISLSNPPSNQLNTSVSSHTLVDGLNDFAFKLYQYEAKGDHNVIISPYSLSSLLAILTVGAKGNTRNQFLSLLNINANHANDLLSELDQLNASLLPNNQSGSFSVANALWATQTFNYKKSFLELNQTNKFLNFYTMDFSSQPEAARLKINDWIEKNTANYIKDLLPIGSVTAQTRLILTNAIYFKGLWKLPFSNNETTTKPFTLSTGKQIQTLMMRQEDRFFYTENPALQMLQLPYADSNLAMIILLPKANHQLNEMFNVLNADSLNQLLSSIRQVKINLSMPKFNIESSFNDLSQSLQTMGLTDAFTDKANFTNMTENQLMISDVIQKALIKVDEQGTIAAAASGIVMVGSSYPVPEPPIVFNADHPFMYIIFDTQSRLILFMGKVSDPSSQ